MENIASKLKAIKEIIRFDFRSVEQKKTVLGNKSPNKMCQITAILPTVDAQRAIKSWGLEKANTVLWKLRIFLPHKICTVNI